MLRPADRGRHQPAALTDRAVSAVGCRDAARSMPAARSPSAGAAGRRSRPARRPAAQPSAGRSARWPAARARIMRARRSAPAVATAQRDQRRAEPAGAVRGQHRQPVALPEPSPVERVEPHGAGRHAVAVAEHVHGRGVVVVRVRGPSPSNMPCSSTKTACRMRWCVGQLDRRAHRAAVERRRAPGVVDGAATGAHGVSRRGPCRGRPPAPRFSKAPRPEHAWQRAQPAATPAPTCPCRAR